MSSAEVVRADSRTGKTLRKQSEIEENDDHEQDTTNVVEDIPKESESSPGSDQSDTTIVSEKPEEEKPKDGEEDDDDEKKMATQTNPKVTKLQRGHAFEDLSPPPDRSTCSPQPTTKVTTVTTSEVNGNAICTTVKRSLEKSHSQGSEVSSASLSRDSSLDKSSYKDSSGTNLEEFIRKTMNKTPKDRNMLLKLETDLTNFINEPKHHYLKFPPMSSYDRMLVHRIAAFFGLDHNVDQTGKCVIVNKTSSTRCPGFSFRDHIEGASENKKITGIMRRGINSLDENESHYKLNKPSLLHTKARSLEERQQQYEKVRNKIFKSVDEQQLSAEEDLNYRLMKNANRPSCLTKANDDHHPWSSTDSSGYGTDSSVSKTRGIPKANSFAGISAPPYSQNLKIPHKSASMCADSSVSPHQSGMCSPHHIVATPPGSLSDSSPLSRSSSSGPIHSPGFPPGGGQQVYWVASDIRNIPPGSVIINPQTGQPISNPDGTLYNYTPGQSLSVLGAGNQMYISNQGQPMYNSGCQSTELCQQHMSMMKLSEQSESVGESHGHGGHYAIINPQQPQGTVPQQPGQPHMYQSQQCGQVCYIYPVNFPGTPGEQMNQGLGVDMSSNAQYQPAASNIPGTYQACSAMGSSMEHYPSSMGQQPYSIQYPTSVGQQGQQVHLDSTGHTSYSYPLHYSQASYGQASSTGFYSVASNQAPMGVVSYGIAPSQVLTPSSQASIPTNSSNHSVPIQTLGQPMTIQVSTAMPQNGPSGVMAQPLQGQYVYSQQGRGVGQIKGISSQPPHPQQHPQHPQQQHQQQQTSSTTQVYHVQQASVHPSVVNQGVPLLKNMQMNMQFAGQEQQGSAPSVHGVQQHVACGHQQVTVSAKGVFPDNQSKLDCGRVPGGLVNLGIMAGPPRAPNSVVRPAALNPDLGYSMVGQQSFPQGHVPVAVANQNVHHQAIRSNSSQSSKQQKLKKSRSKESTEEQCYDI